MTDLSARVAALEAAVLALGVEELGDHEGHKFHGNQHVSFDDLFDTDEEQHKRLEKESKLLKAFIGAAEEFGDTPGHEFHGNQWTGTGPSVGAKVTGHHIDGTPAFHGTVVPLLPRDKKPPFYKETDRRIRVDEALNDVMKGKEGQTVTAHSQYLTPRGEQLRDKPVHKANADRESREAREMRMIRNTDPSAASRIERLGGARGDAARRNYVNSGTDPSWYGG